MLDHPILDVALGLMAFYAVFSLVASAVQEWIAGLCRLRSSTLRSGIENFVDDGNRYVAPVVRLSQDTYAPASSQLTFTTG